MKSVKRVMPTPSSNSSGLSAAQVETATKEIDSSLEIHLSCVDGGCHVTTNEFDLVGTVDQDLIR